MGVHEDSRKFTGFVTEDGFYECLRVPFGLKNAPSHFQRVVDSILGMYRLDFALAYIDDIIIYSKTLEEHLDHVDKVLEALRSIGMTITEEKCHFAYDNVELLGHRVGRLGLSTLKERVEAINALPYPKTVKEASTIFAKFNYHRDFIPRFAEIALPITKAMGQNKRSTVSNRKAKSIKAKRKESDKPKISPKEMAKARYALPFPDTEEIRKAFEILKARLSSAPVLIHPDFDREFILYTDACRKGIGAGLYQVSLEDNKLHPILFISRQLKDAETRYSATELECLGLVWSLHKLQHYVDGAKLMIYTDHAALKWIWNAKATVNSRLFRWALLLNPL